MVKKVLSEFRRSSHFKWFVLLLITLYIGVICNLIVVKLNGGMPIVGFDAEYIEAISPYSINQVYVPITSETRLAFLGDILVNGDMAYSLGDLLMWLSVLGVFANLVLYIIWKERNNAKTLNLNSYRHI